MTIAQALKKFPSIESDLLLGHVLKQPKEFLYIHNEELITGPQLKSYLGLAAKRLAGVPAAYLVGYKYFCGLKFKVNRGVLIPRPESEWLVDQAVSNIKKRLKNQKTDRPIKILDMGTGSGCIAISIAKHFSAKEISVLASDISGKALAVAETNAKANKTKIKFIESNQFNKISGQFDIIIANLPYVPEQDYKKFYQNLRYEPVLALKEKADFPLLKRFILNLKNHVRAKSLVLIETDPTAFKYLTKFIKQTLPTVRYKFYKDLHGLNRYARIDS